MTRLAESRFERIPSVLLRLVTTCCSDLPESNGLSGKAGKRTIFVELLVDFPPNGLFHRGIRPHHSRNAMREMKDHSHQLVGFIWIRNDFEAQRIR